MCYCIFTNSIHQKYIFPHDNTHAPSSRAKEAAKAQMEKLWHTTNIYLNDPLHAVGEKLAAKLPGDLKVRITIPSCRLSEYRFSL